jgi:hypothetical protein
MNDFGEQLRNDPKYKHRFDAADKAAGKANGHDAPPAPLTPAAWKARDLPEQDRLMGDLLTTTSRVMLAADTGLGKTLFTVALAVAMRLGRDFLHWKAHREARIMFVDGEMPRELMKERIIDAFRQAGVEPVADGMFFVSREDFEDMPPLDSEDGQTWLLALVEKVGGVDFIVFDNLMSLCVGDLRDEESWKSLKPLVAELTKRRIGQLWVHHTGHDKSRPYGSKTFQWMLDAVIVGEAVEEDDAADVTFKLTFQKSRRRTPANRADFEPVKVTLAEDQWGVTGVTRDAGPKPKKLGKRATVALQALETALAHAGEKPPTHDVTRGVTQAVHVTTWRRYFDQKTEHVYAAGSSARRQAWACGIEELLATRKVVIWGEWVWLGGERHERHAASRVTPGDVGDSVTNVTHASYRRDVRDAPRRDGDDAGSPPADSEPASAEGGAA